MEWLEPWYSIDDDPEHSEAMVQELARELSPDHALYGLPVRASARRQDCDDVLFFLDDGTDRVAVVHLTWTRNPPESPPWPGTMLYSSLEEWTLGGVRVDHEEFFA